LTRRGPPRRPAVRAYANNPPPIGHGQTISQPYIVALKSELLETSPGDTVLEVGTGSGDHSAALAEMGVAVHSIEIVPALARRARRAAIRNCWC
jgi:protein-L-isoaspartate(D-aspartate) O-methyltransferase